MKKFILLFLLLSSQFAYATQYGWGDNPDAVVIRKPAAVLVFTKTGSDPFKLGADTDSSDALVIVDRGGNSFHFLLREVSIKQLGYTTAIIAEGGDLVFELRDAPITYHTTDKYTPYNPGFPASNDSQ